jgi:hypothetical protein
MSISNDGNCCESSIAGNAFTDFSGTSVHTQDLYSTHAFITDLTGVHIRSLHITGTIVDFNRGKVLNITGNNIRYAHITGIDATMTNVSATSISGINATMTNIGGTDATYTNIRGTMITGTQIRADPGVFAGQLGSRFAPLYSFNSNIDSGMYSTASEVIIAESTTDVLGCTSSNIKAYQPILAPNGSASAPAYAFTSSTSSGLYSSASNNVDVSANNTQVANFKSTDVTLYKPLTNGQQPFAYYVKTLSQTNGTNPNLVTFDAVDDSQNNPISYTGGVFTITQAGVYLINYFIQTTAGVSGRRTSFITLNEASPTNTSFARVAVDPETYSENGSSFIRKLLVNDAIRLVYYSPDTTSQLVGGANGSRCNIQFVKLF